MRGIVIRAASFSIVILFGMEAARAAVPLWFEPNQGQAHASVQFLARGVYLGDTRLAIHSEASTPIVMDLIGARKNIRAEGLDLQPGISSYFLGNDPKKWRSGVPHYARVRYKDVYPGIDVIYYHNAEGRLEYDFTVQPGADASAIRLAYNQPLHVDATGDLLIAGLRQRRPRVYQNGTEIACEYLAGSKNQIRIALASYDHSQPLTVDPALVYSTYLGGPAFEVGTGMQVDAKGFMYVSLFERAPSSPTLNPFQQTSGGAYAAFVAKFTPDGQSNVYYAYVGGTADTYAEALAVDPDGNAYVTGQTRAFDFPVKNAFQPQYGGGFNDSYALKISPDGRTILYATYLGGNNEDEASAITVNSNGEAYIVGFTYSIDFPVVKAFQPQKGNGADGFLTHLSADGKSLMSSTFLGGDYGDYIHGLALDISGFIYLTGGTDSDDFPVKNALQANLPGSPGLSLNTFITKLTPAADALVYSTFFGGSAASGGWAIAVDSTGSPSICGVSGPGFPTKNAFQASYGGGQEDIFVARLTADGSAVVFSTYVGGSDLDFQNANTLALDSSGNIYVTGWTGSSDFPLKQSLQSFNGATSGYRFDAFILKFTPAGSLVYSTLIGGNGDDRGGAITVDSSNTVYVTGSTSSDDFPLMNPFQKTYGGGVDVFILKLAPDVTLPSPFSPTPGTAHFTFVVGGSVPAAQMISIPSGGQFSITSSNAPWASASPQSGTTPGTLTISVNPAGLTPKVYSGTIQIVPPSGTPFTLPVTLNVLAPAPVVTSISPSTVALNSGATAFTVTGSGFTSASVVELQGASQLTTTFIDSGTLQFSLTKDFFTLSGSYSINVVAPQTAPSSPVTFTVGTPAPLFAAAGVVNAASYASGSVAPGEIVTVFGFNFGTNFGTPGNTSVTFDNVPATLVYVTATQLAATVPYSVSGALKTAMIIASNGVSSTPVSLNVTDAVPAIFTSDASGMGQAAALNQDNTVNGPSDPAPAGSVVALYGTGGGALTTDPLPQLTLPVTATIGGVPATVYYAGMAPGLVEGAMQVNVQIPDGVTPGPAVPVAITVGNATSNAVTLAIQ
jgi:uncharacterized protein (TIGR03437 family)